MRRVGSARLVSRMELKCIWTRARKRFETVYPAAGDDHSAVRLTIPELEEVSGAKGWVDVCREPEDQQRE